MPAAGIIESRTDRQARARALAAFYGAGALLSTMTVLLPGWDTMNVPGIAATIGPAAVSAVLLYRFADRISRGMNHGLYVTGTGLIATCQVFAGGGSPTAMYAMLYIWVILHCALFFPRSAILTHLGLTTVAHGAALVWLGQTDALAASLVLTLGTQVAAAIVVGSLADRQRSLADTDQLTGLGNRRVATRALDAAIDARAVRVSGPPCLALLDLDGFKAFNDRAGHLAGDAVLAEAASAWQAWLRPGDTLARTGGDEFLLVLPGSDLHEGERILRRMLEVTPGDVTCSAGLARWRSGEIVSSLFERADRALYRAKVAGPVVVADDEPAPDLAQG